MGNYPSQTTHVVRPVVRVDANQHLPGYNDRPTTTNVPGYKARPAPSPPTNVPSYKNPYNLVLPSDPPNGVLKSWRPNTAENEFYIKERDEENQLGSPDEYFNSHDAKNTNRAFVPYDRARAKSVPNNSIDMDRMQTPLRLGNYTPNGEIIKGRQLQYPLSKNKTANIITEDRPKSALVYLQNGHSTDDIASRMMSESGRASNGDLRVTFAPSRTTPALGEVVRPIQRRQKCRAPSPPRSLPSGDASEKSVKLAPLPPAVQPLNKHAVNQLRAHPVKDGLRDQLQEEIIKEAKARQSRDPVAPPKIQKPKSGNEIFREELIAACKKIETYGEESDMEPTTPTEWDDLSYDTSDYTPKVMPKFLVKQNIYRLEQGAPISKDIDERLKPSENRALPVKSEPEPEPRAVSRKKFSNAHRSTNISPRGRPNSAHKDSELGNKNLGSEIKLISTTKAKSSPNDWTPEQDLKEDIDDGADPAVDRVTLDSRRSSELSFIGAGVRLNPSESSIGSVRMCKRTSIDQDKSDKPTRHEKNLDKDASIRGKYSSLKNTIRTAFSSLGTSTKIRKDRKSVRGYFDQRDYRYGPDVQPVVFYHMDAQGPFPVAPGYYPVPYAPGGPQYAPAPMMPYGAWYEDPYRMYPRGNMQHMQLRPMQPFLYTDGTNRRAMSMDEISREEEWTDAHHVPVVYADWNSRSKSRQEIDRRESSGYYYGSSWDQLKDGVQYDGKNSWRYKNNSRSRSEFGLSREPIDDWTIGGEVETMREIRPSVTYDSDDEYSFRSTPVARTAPRREDSRAYEEEQFPNRGRRRPAHVRKPNSSNTSSSDEIKPPIKLLKGMSPNNIHERSNGLPPSGARLRGRFRKNGDDVQL